MSEYITFGRHHCREMVVGLFSLWRYASLGMAFLFAAGACSSVEGQTFQPAKPGQRVSFPGRGQATAISNGTPVSQAATETPEEALDADLKEAISMLQQRKLNFLMHDFLPPGFAAQLEFTELRRRSQQRDLQPQPILPNETVADLAAHFEAALTGQRTFNRNKTLVEINYIRKAVELIPDSAPDYVPTIADRPKQPVIGLGSDLQQMLLQAAKLLDARKYDDFVNSVYPLAELARLEQEDGMERHILRITSRPEMKEAMLRDLKAVYDSPQAVTVSGSMAEANLPALVPGDTPRIIRFELVDGNWRFFDGGRSTHEEQKKLVEKSAGGYTLPGSKGSMVLSYSDGSWRLIGMPTSDPLF